MKATAAETGQGEPTSLTVQASWLLIAKVAGFVASVLIPLFLVRGLNKTQFGLYKQVFLVVGTAQAILPLGFAFSAFYFLPRERQRRSQIVCHIAAFNLCVGVLAFAALCAFPRVLDLVFGAPQLQPYAVLLGILILVTISGSFLEIVGTANQDVRWSAVFIVLAQLSKTLFMVAAAVLAPSIQALMVASILQGTLQSGILAWYLQTRFPGVWGGIDWRLVRTQLSYSLPFGLYGLFYTLGADVPHYLIAAQFGPAQYAVYAVGCLQLPLFGLIYDSAVAVMLPRLSVLQQRGEARELLLVSIRAMTKLALFCLPVFFFLVACGREFLVVLFTKRYADSWPLFLVNLALIPSAIVPFDPIFRSHSEHRLTPLRVQVLTTTALVIALWFALPGIGMLGAAVLIVSCRLLERVILTVRAAVILGFQAADFRLLRDVGLIVLGAALSSAAAFAVRAALGSSSPLLILIVSGTVFAAVYGIAVMSCRVVTVAELKLFRERFNPAAARFGTAAAAPDLYPQD